MRLVGKRARVCFGPRHDDTSQQVQKQKATDEAAVTMRLEPVRLDPKWLQTNLGKLHGWTQTAPTRTKIPPIDSLGAVFKFVVGVEDRRHTVFE